MKTGVFFDTSDLYHRVKRKYKRKLDYAKIMAELRSEYDIISAIAYVMQSENEASGFISCLKRAEIQVKARRPDVIPNGDRTIRRSNSNVELTVDVMTRLDRLDCVVLGTGNPVFQPLINHITSRGIKCQSLTVVEAHLV